MTIKTREAKDKRIQALHAQAGAMWPKIEKIIDEMKRLGDSREGDNALQNTNEWLKQLAGRTGK